MPPPPFTSLLLLACADGVEDSAPVVLPEETGTLPADSPAPWTWGDSGTGTVTESPEHTLYVIQEGSWTLSPPGGPYTDLVGTLSVDEYVDELPESEEDTGVLPSCSVRYALTGVVAAQPCDNCRFTFAVQHTVTSGDPALCYDPELPPDHAAWSLGLDEDYRGSEDWILRDWGDAGLWLPWYTATFEDDTVRLSWSVAVGVAVEEEEEE